MARRPAIYRRDVLYTYQVTVDPKTPTAYAEDFRAVKKAEALDDYTFRVTYDKPFAPALISWGSSILPRHLLSGKDITKSPLARHPIGTGPYKFKEWVAGQKLFLFPIPIILKDGLISMGRSRESFPIPPPCFWSCAPRTLV